MKMKAAVLTVILCLLLSFTRYGIGCTGERRNGSGRQEEYDYLITVGMVQGGEDSEWKTANTESFQSIFTEENGYKFLYEDAGEDLEKQIEAVRSFAENGVDYILLSPVAEMGWEDVLTEVRQLGSSLILINRQIDESDTSMYECWVGSDYEEQARQAGKWIENYLENEERQNEEIDIAMIQGVIGSPEQMARAEGYQKIFDKNSNWEIVGQQTGENNRETAKEVMRLFLDSETKPDIVIAESDQMALGAIEAIKESGLSCGKNGEIIVVSFDASRSGLQAVLDGCLNVTFEHTPVLAPKTAEIIQKLEAGINVEKKQYIKERWYDEESQLLKAIRERAY